MDSNNQNKPLVSQSTERLAIDGYQPYAGPAGGWGALAAVAHSIREEMQLSTRTHALLQMNQPDGFDCPGCAWPDPKHTSSFEFCENGRSEEHTSELQSRGHLVCRLLLEKK